MNRFLTAAAVLALAGGVVAQDETAPEPTPMPEATVAAAPSVDVTWPDEESHTIADMLTGLWESATPIDDTGATIVMSVAQVDVNGVEGTLYAEVSRSDDLANPFRQIIMRLYRFNGDLRLRTLEFRGETGPMLAGMAHIPERFPQTVTVDDLIATLDIELTPDGNGYSGTTPYAYPTRTAGAVQMTSSITITPDRIITEDTGFGTNGEVVWGGPDGAVTFERAEGMVEVTRLEREDWSHQYIQINYIEGEGDPPRDGDFLALHYSGYLTDGSKFDSSRDRGAPFRYRVPGRLIEGWLMGTEDIRQGGVRRLVLPPELGYGDRANPSIPANSTLMFDVEAIFIERADEPGENPAEAEAIEDAAGGE